MKRSTGAWIAAGAIAAVLTTAGYGRDGMTRECGWDSDARWYRDIRAEVTRLRTKLLSHVGGTDIAEGSKTQIRLEITGMVDGLLGNLDAEVRGAEERLAAAQLEHDAQENEFCSAANTAHRLIERVREDPEDAGDALTAAAQCREAYRGAVSFPISEEIEDLRNLCVIARDRAVKNDPSVVWEPELAAIYAVGKCAEWRGAAWLRHSLTGNHYKDFADADSFVGELKLHIMDRKHGGG